MVPTAMVISPHADDAAAFCGGTLAKFAAMGWNVVLVRVTDDCKDSVMMDVDATRETNAKELRDAAKILGVNEIVELGYETDCLADVSLVGLRERIVYMFRKYRPYSVFTFDSFGLYEDNMDHIRVAQAVEEAFWVSAFDLHHPEHFKQGLKPFCVCERWRFARELPKVTHVEDVTDYIDKKIDAFGAHRAMVENMLQRFILHLETWGRRSKLLEDAKKYPYDLLKIYLTEQGKDVAAEHGLPEGRLGEAFRMERFGDLEGLFQLFSEPLPGAPAGVYREGLDPPKE